MVNYVEKRATLNVQKVRFHLNCRVYINCRVCSRLNINYRVCSRLNLNCEVYFLRIRDTEVVSGETKLVDT